MTEKNIHQRIAAAMQKVDYIQKEKKQGMRYTIVSHDAVTGKVRPALLENGVIYYPVGMTRNMVGNRTEVEMTVRFVNVDDPKDFIDVVTAGYGIDDQDKGIGKAISYAVKYALLKTLGLETGDDPDQDQEVVHRNDDDAFPGDKRPEIPADDIKIVELAMMEAANMAHTVDDLLTGWKQHSNTLKQLGIVKGHATYQRLENHFAAKKRELMKEAA